MALSASEVTHAFTLKSRWLSSAILHGLKPVENRSTAWKIGWYAVHTGVATDADRWAHEHVRAAGVDSPTLLDQVLTSVSDGRIPRGCIVGLCAISHVLPPYCVVGAHGERSAWALGPYCMVISHVVWLHTPVPCRGNLNNWPLSDETRRVVLSSMLVHPLETQAMDAFPANEAELARWRAHLREEKRKRRKRALQN